MFLLPRIICKRWVFSVPAHLKDIPQRAKEYKIGRVRLSATLEEGAEVLGRYEADGDLELDELNVYVNKCAEQECLEKGLWAVEMIERNFGKNLSVWEYNNIMYLYFKCWKPDEAMATFLKIRNPTNETYSTFLRVCIDGMKRAKSRTARMKYTKLGITAVEQAEDTCNLIDGRFFLLRSVLHFFNTIPDEKKVAHYRALLDRHNREFTMRKSY